MFNRHISKNMAAYAEGELDPHRSRLAEAHLSHCGRCRGEFEEVRLGMELVRHLPLARAPEGLWLSIEGALEQRQRPPQRIWRLAAVAALFIAIAAGVYWWGVRQPKAYFQVASLDGSPSVASRRIAGSGRVGAGEWVETDEFSRARIRIGEIGSVDVEPNTRIRVLPARAAEHRLALESGEIKAKISAPPRLFFVETSSGTAVDLGCEYELRCDRAGFGLLRVSAGWVSYEWAGRESLVPAGAACRTRPGRGPGTPYFEDAPEPLVRALEAFDFEDAGSNSLAIILAASRSRDTLTLWHLLSRAEAGERPRVYDRLAKLSPPPNGISREQILRLDPDALKRWKLELAWTW